MTEQLKLIKWISLFLFAVFIFPQAIQSFHVLTVHHHKTHCTAKNEKHFHIANEHCPIHEYVFAITHKIELPPQISKFEIHLHGLLIANETRGKLKSLFQYYLRGPPGASHFF